MIIATLAVIGLLLLGMDIWYIVTHQMTQNGHLPFFFPVICAILISAIRYLDRRRQDDLVRVRERNPHFNLRNRPSHLDRETHE